jgi:hypothetical protein
VDDSSSHVDSKLDEALEETFPASDPAANTVETGIRTGEVPPTNPSVKQPDSKPIRDDVNGETTS